jgi:FKBP-type peptidyl-prolyl cis-trans isomerase FkpA
MRASYEGRGYPLDEEARRLRDDFSKQVQAMLAAEQPDPVKEYFRNLREHEAVRQTASGLHYRITLEGTGPPPSSDSVVVYSFSARLPNGTALPKLVGVRLRAAMADLLPGVREGLLLLHKGGKALIYVPAALSFGDGPWPSEVPKGEPVIFFIELHDVLPASSARG